MKTYKYIIGVFAMLMAFAMQSCSEDVYDVQGNPENLFYFCPKGGLKTTYEFNVNWTAAGGIGDNVSLSIPVRCSREVAAETKVRAEVDNSLVAGYNATHSSNYEAFPEGSCVFTADEVTINAGSSYSEASIECSVPSDKFLDLTGREYLIPVKLTGISGTEGRASNSYGTIWAVVNVVYPGDVKQNVYITGKPSAATVVRVEEAPATYSFTLSTSEAVRQDETVKLEADRSLVDAYNKSKGTKYVALPENAQVTIEGTDATIKLNEKVSAPIKVTLNSLDGLTLGTQYMLPITIKEVSVGLQAQQYNETMYLVFNYTEPINAFTALDISDYNCYSNYWFASDKQVTLDKFTYEIKIKANKFSGISRFFAFNGSQTMMFRFGESGKTNTLQCVTGSGTNFFTTRTFETNKWYLISVTFDGRKVSLYVNGEKDSERYVYNYAPVFKGVEIGMSWAGYPSSQTFDGSICDVRVWTRALSQDEIKSGLCGVEPESDGLKAYWKMGEGKGNIFYDCTGNGYDIDWSDTYRCVKESESDPGTHLTDRHKYIKWDTSESNICE